jgi:hypothetical protein
VVLKTPFLGAEIFAEKSSLELARETGETG